jgi:hypothetical protein
LVTVRIAALLAAAIAVSGLVWVMVSTWRARSTMGVQVSSGGQLPSPDARGTDIWATIDNPNPMPVDLKVRVRAYDITHRVVLEKILGPFRRVPPGESYPIQAYLDATPLDSVTFEAVDVEPTDPPSP